MKLFQNLFKPKWKNHDPAVRKQAILALDAADNQGVLTEIASHDESSDLRLLALKRITDFDFIILAAESNTNIKVKELANKLVKQTLSGETDSALDEEQKILAAQKINDQKLFEYIAEKGTTVSLRQASIERISREALLGNLAISDDNSDIRNTAAQKISQKSTLERVYRATKTKDKNVSRIAKERLDRLISEAEKPAKLLAAQKSLCASVEGLGKKGLWQRDKLQFDNLLLQWAALDSDEPLALSNRLEQAKNTFTQAYEAFLSRHEERLSQEAAFLPVKNEKQAVINQLYRLISQLEKSPNLTGSELAKIKQLTLEQETSWSTIETLPDNLEEDIRLQFDDALNNIKQDIKQREHNTTLLDSLEKLQRDITKTIKQPHKLSQTGIHRFEKTWGALNPDKPDDNVAKIKQEIKNKIDQAGDLLAKQQDKMASLLVEVNTQIENMEVHLNNGVLKEAIGLRNTIQNSIVELEKHGVRNLHEQSNRLNQTSKKINELSNWRSWANTPQKEQLINKVEALISSDLDPKEIAYIVSHARKEWKNLGPSERGTSQALWEKFQAACDKAYEPCKVYFAEESKTLAVNFEKRIKFLETLEEFLDKADWEHVDWRKVETLFRHARQEWSDLGLTDKKKRKDLNSRFNKSHNRLKSAINKEWDKNVEKKSAIANEALALSSEENLQTAINEAKTLQQRWKKAGRIQHAKERELWAQFKQACDAVFARREDLSKQQDAEAQQKIDEKNGLITKIEVLCNLPAEKLNSAKPEFVQLKKDLNDFGQTNAETDASINKRLSGVLHLYERKQESLLKLKVISDLTRLKEKADICLRLEQAIESGEPDDIENLTAEMEGTQEASEIEWDRQMRQRYQTSLQLAKQENAGALFLQETQKNLEQINMTTVQLEIIADIETPKSAMGQRLKVQTQRLSDKMKGNEEENLWESFVATEANWLTIGPTLHENMTTLSQRREKAIDALKLEYPEELKDY